MRIVALTLLLFGWLAFEPAPYPAPIAGQVVAATKFIKFTGRAGAASTKRRHRRRARRIVYRKPPVVYISPDVVEVYSQAEWEQSERFWRGMSQLKWNF
jgi:hypothetical protein